MNSNTIQITLEVDDQGTMKIRQFGKEAAAAGSAGAKGFDGLRQSSERTMGTLGKTSAAVSLVKTTIASLVSALALEKLIALADAYTRIEGRLKLVTSSSAELASVQASLYDIAQRSRAEYIATADTYARFAQATKGQNMAQSELLTLTETLSKAFVISGANTQEQSSAMVQLSQAFSSGVLRGDEFNSVMESGGRIIDMLTAYTGKSRGELRAMAEAGEITGDVLRKAILAGAAGVNDEFGRMPLTVGQAGTKLMNVLGQIINDANQATSSTQNIAGAIDNVAAAADRNKGAIKSFFQSLARDQQMAFDGVGMVTQEQVKNLDLVIKHVAKSDEIRRKISDIQAEIDRMNAAPGLKAINVANGDFAKLTANLAGANKELKSLVSSPYITGEAAKGFGAIATASRLAAEGQKELSFRMQGVKTQSESSMKITDEMRKKTLAYIDTERQALAKKRDEMLSGARTDAERSAVELKYRAELAELNERKTSGRKGRPGNQHRPPKN